MRKMFSDRIGPYVIDIEQQEQHRGKNHSKKQQDRRHEQTQRKKKLFSSLSGCCHQLQECEENDHDSCLKNPNTVCTRSSINSNDNLQTYEVISSVCTLIRRKKWKKLAQRLRQIERKMGYHQHHRTDLLCLSGGFIQETDENCLHLACRFNAPFSIIQRLCAISPNLALECSFKQKATPLHVAVSNKSVSIEVVDFLLSLNVTASCTKDVNLCTPLHLICRYTECGRNIDPLEDPFVTYPALAFQEEVALIIRALCEVHPWCINDEDEFGMTPIEYAIEAKLEYSLIKYLWGISSSQWKKQRECAKKLQRVFAGGQNNQTQRSSSDDTDQDAYNIYYLSDLIEQEPSPIQRVTQRTVPYAIFTDTGSTNDTVSTTFDCSDTSQSLIGLVLETTRQIRRHRQISQ